MTICGFYRLTLLALLGYRTCNASTTSQPKKGYGESCSGHIECDVPQGGSSQCVSDVMKCLCSEGWYWSGTQCQDINTLKPTLTLSNPGQQTVYAAWTANSASDYTSLYTLTWKSSPGSPGRSHSTSGQSYTIPALSPGTTYTVSISRTITEKTHGRIQNVPGDDKTETTRAPFGAVCSTSVLCDVTDTNMTCTQTTAQGVNRCLCRAGTYRPSDSCVAIAPGLKPVLQGALSTDTRRINVRWTNDDVTGGYSSLYMVEWTAVPPGTSGSENTTVKNHFIQPLSPGTTYSVTVTHIITQYNRNQLIPSDARTYTTRRQEYGGTCNTSVPCDDASNTISCNSLVSKCLCVDGMYRNGQACVQYSTLSPSFGTTTTGTSYVYVQWSDQPASNYNDVYQLTISPDGTVRTATGKFYNFTNLQQGTNYTVSLVRTITRYGRNQSLPAVTTTTRTKVGYNQPCQSASDTCIDAHTSCQGSTCRCDVRFYWDTNCVSIDGFKPTAVTVSVNSTTTMTASWESPDNVVITGYEVTVMPGDIPQITVGKDIKTTPITGLTPGRQYNVSVKTKITYLQGRDEKTAALSAQPKVTTPDTVDGLGDKTNLTAPNIIIDFLKADGDVGYYQVKLQGITDGSYLQTMSVAPPVTNTTFSGVVPNYQYILTITTYSNQQQSIPYTRTILVRGSQQAFGGVCNDTFKCATASGSNIQCIQTTESNKKCLCRDGWYRPLTACQEYSTLKPVITDQPSIGTGNIDISWTHTGVTGGYTSSFTVSWSPGSPGSATTQQTTYNIQSLSPGTAVTVTVAHTITLYGRSQSIVSDQKMFITRIGYNETCAQRDLCFDAHSNCYSGRCRCDQGYYRSTTCTSIEQLRPTSVAAYVNDTTTMTASWVAPSNAVITGYEVSVTPGGITPISVGTDIRTTPITGLTPGRLYTVSVKTKITYLQGRDEMTDAVPAASKRTHAGNISPVSCVGERSSCPSFTYRIGQLRRIPLALSPATGFTRWILLLRQPLVLQQL